MGSEKNYQFLALTVKGAWEKCEKRMAFMTLADSGAGGLETGGIGDGQARPHAMASAHEDTRAINRSHSHSTSPRIPRHPAASLASTWELGFQTLADVLRARMRQGFRCWVTHTRQNKLQDLHSSVLQALQFAAAGPTHVAQAAATSSNRQKLGNTARMSPQGDHPEKKMENMEKKHPHSGIHNIENGMSQSSKETVGRQPKIQAGASFAGNRYCGDSLRLRSKERHVRHKEKHHGSHHPEVAHALISLAGHHAEKGNTKAQQEALQRAMNIQRNHALFDNRGEGMTSHRNASPEHATNGAHLHPAISMQRRATWDQNADNALLHAALGHRGSPAKTDAVLRQLYADQARIDEVIKLASKLWDSGVLAAGPRKPPILKSSLLLRLAERWYHVSMRDAVQHWWRQGSRQRAAQEIKQREKHNAQRESKDAHHNHGGGVWQDPRSANPLHVGASGTVHLGAPVTSVEEYAEECRKLREKLQEMAEREKRMAAEHENQIKEHQEEALDANILRDQISALREELRAERETNQNRAVHQSHQETSRAVIEQPLQSQVAHSAPHHAPSHHAPSHRGKLTCRILVVRHLKLGSSESDLDVFFGNPFVIARVGTVQFQTNVSADIYGNDWESHSFEFPVNLRDPHQRVLGLKVVNHRLFHSGENLGEIQIKDLQVLPPGQAVRKTEQLRNGHGAELDVELCFTPEYHSAGHHDAQEDDVASVDGGQDANPNGVLLCRVKAVRNVSEHEPLVGAFVVAHLGNQDFRTKVATEHHGTLTWNMDAPFRFKEVDISHLRHQYLYLRLCKESSFHSLDHCIGTVKVHIPKLSAHTWVPMRESFHHQSNRELEFELRFVLDGEIDQDGDVLDDVLDALGGDRMVSESKAEHATTERRSFTLNTQHQSAQNPHTQNESRNIDGATDRHHVSFVSDGHRLSTSVASVAGETVAGTSSDGHREDMGNTTTMGTATSMATSMGATTTMTEADQSELNVDSDNDDDDQYDDEDIAGLLGT